MPVNNPRELFVQLLSGLRQGTERSTKIYQEISKLAEDPDVKEALEAQAFISEKVLATLDHASNSSANSPRKSIRASMTSLSKTFAGKSRYKTRPQGACSYW